MKKTKFNIIWNEEEDKAMGKGYYLIFEDNQGKPCFSKYWAIATNEKWNGAETVHTSIIEDLKNNIYNGMEFDIFYSGINDLYSMFEDTETRKHII